MSEEKPAYFDDKTEWTEDQQKAVFEKLKDRPLNPSIIQLPPHEDDRLGIKPKTLVPVPLVAEIDVDAPFGSVPEKG